MIGPNTDRPGNLAWMAAALLGGLTLAAGNAVHGSSTPVYRWTTLAGRASLGAEDGPRLEARFNEPHGMGFDAFGNLFVADTGNHTIRKISPEGIVSTFAGAAGEPGNSDGPGPTARFNSPHGLGLDRQGNVHVADTGNHTIRRIAPTGYVTTLAGQPGVGGTADGAASLALFDAPDRIAVGPNGEVYLSDHGVRKIAGGIVSTLPVPAEVTDADGRILTVSTDRCPAVDAQGFLYFSTTTNSESLNNPHAEQIVRLAPDGTFSIIRTSYFSASDPGSMYAYRYVSDTLYNDAAGNLFLAAEVDSYFVPRYVRGLRLQPDGTLDESSVALFQTYLGQPAVPSAVALSPDGRWFYTCPAEDEVKSVDGTYAGAASAASAVDGDGASARFEGATHLAMDPAGSVWVAEAVKRYLFDGTKAGFAWCTRLRKIDAVANVTTPAQPWYPATFSLAAPYNYPTGLNADGSGVVTMTRTEDRAVIRYIVNQVFPDGSVTAMTGPDDDIHDPVITGGILYALNLIYASAGPPGRAYQRIVRRTPDGTWAVVAGGPSAEMRDGAGPEACFLHPSSMTAGPGGNIYLLDSEYDGTHPVASYVRRISPAGEVTTVSQRLTSRPTNLAVDGSGRFFLTHASSHVVSAIDAEGGEVTIGGAAGVSGSADGVGTAARFANPGAITRDDQGNLYVIDDAGATVRKGEYLGEGPSLSLQPQGMTVPSGGNASFEVQADGSPAPIYQWYFNGAAIAGSTGRTLALTGVRASDAGDYTVVVSNEFGSVTSAKATLAVVDAAVTPPSGSNDGNAGGGGGGAVSPAFLLALLISGLIRFCRRREATP